MRISTVEYFRIYFTDIFTMDLAAEIQFKNKLT